MDNNPCVMELRGISKQYPGGRKKANNNVSLDLRGGEILCIAGENGAGKTTLMKILYGLEIPDEGEIFINGKKEKITSPFEAKKLGIGMVHQHFMLFPEYTVAENIVIGMEPRKLGVFFDTRTANKIADSIIGRHNFAIDSRQKVKDLSLGQMQQVEICSILNRNANIIILDEPTSILTEQETGSLFETLKNLAAGGKSVILITHKLREIMDICDRVAVMRKGEMTGIHSAPETGKFDIARLVLGDNFSSFVSTEKTEEKPAVKKEPVIVFDNVTVMRKKQKRPLLDKVSFSLNSGEILGITGVGGNGLGVIEAVLGGFLHPSDGKIFHRGKDISAFDNRALREGGLAFVPSDRLSTGSAREATIEENIIINRRDELTRGIFLNKKAIREFCGKLISGYNIENAKENKKCAVLSGGNLQKLVLAREIDYFRDYIVFSEPTWGLDIASGGFIRNEIEKLRGKGAAIALLSTDIEEILSLADRIIVMYRGGIAGEIANTKEPSVKARINNYMQGITGK